MNKSKVILAATGGVIGVAVLVMAFFVWSAYSAKTAALEGDEEEGTEGLEAVVQTAQKLSRDKVYPCAASVKAVQSNETLLVAWKDEALKLASRGDRPVKQTTPAQFKADMVAEAQRLLTLPGQVTGRIAKPEFAFGPFREYIAEGKMPTEAKLGELQRQWDDIVLIVETLANCGVAELVDIQFKAQTEEGADAKDARKGARKQVKNAKAAKEERKPAIQGYVVTFVTRPLGFVKSLNAFETCERFVVVEGFSFLRDRDLLNEALGGGEKNDKSQPTAGRRRRRGGPVVEKTEEEKPKSGIITDPLMDTPFKVELTLSTYDFRTLEGAAKEEEKK